MRVHHWPRRLAIQIAESRLFDPLILLTNLANCFTMAWVSPLDPTPTAKSELVATAEWWYLYIFTFELLTKVIAYDFALNGKESYLRDAWCQLDFVIVSLAWAPVR